jgi:hypothetical protein
MIIGDRNGDHIAIEFCEAAPQDSPGAGDFSVSIELRSGAFSGAVSGVWLAVTDCDSFLSQLRSLEAHRKGAAELIGMSENHCLNLCIDSPASPVSVSGDLLTNYYSLSVFHQQRLQFSFSVEQEFLPQLLAGFAWLFSTHEHSMRSL